MVVKKSRHTIVDDMHSSFAQLHIHSNVSAQSSTPVVEEVIAEERLVVHTRFIHIKRLARTKGTLPSRGISIEEVGTHRAQDTHNSEAEEASLNMPHPSQ